MVNAPVSGARAGRPAIRIDDASYRYPHSSHPVLAHLSLTAAVGEHIALVGRSGCGKSTLLRLIAGLAEPVTGTIEVLGHRDPHDRLDGCAMMPQNDLLLPWLRLVDNVAIGLRNKGVARREARTRALAVLDQWGLAEWSRSRPDKLSGGMRQRAALARALLADKPVLLADEPLGSLDAITRADGQRWLRRAVLAAGATLILVTHDVEEALLLSRRVILLGPAGPRPAAAQGSWPGWFDDDRRREQILADPRFAAARTAVLEALGDSAEASAGSGPVPGESR
ncbi:ABC transporter ATP-binding protein [Acidipropionibacterium jensenii]|uniref:Bicarbonate transport ATP-binding protein CmpD n=1 Tax=Acidipropionibacterium jensenii TaxID=1749 RepID=A0A448NW69_9ACTN|nr:ABC transporter ATP-binding protein [Acidipropionibacterium jensenii]MDN5977063.1 ABC transporter ATP-binding protein [Acidipropionibacterium jensenii]MDN5995798.1 ABC transporter ATP-binding protein [Acidipropionibacterium jensenii]MDN6441353.1 ABC transporter ATP-binding protein [Acidipropionibacterium jensenii]MDN6591602.1 ABC transporter ATP-binding protein [Acidipropionibacterium jensenii]MDN6760989.1 ABC transporter ATP-binding protein [Acidipropionibacterium jensenii]